MTKDTASNTGIRLPWAGKVVSVERLEEELAQLWKMSADNMRTGQNVNVRTSVLNLVICASDIESAQRANSVIRDLSSTHLARVVILILDRNNEVPSNISTWVTLRCFSMISDVMRHCFEQTTLLASGTAARSAANIIQPLLKPDLPVYIWWIGDPPTQDQNFNNLVTISTRVIVDSKGFFKPEQDIRSLASLLQASPDCALSDLNWGLLTAWRQLIIQFFDAPEYRPYLTGIHHIEIEHVAAPLATQTRSELSDVSPNPAKALMLAGWLKARLGWNLQVQSTHNRHDTESGTYRWNFERTINSTRGKNARTGVIEVRPRVESQLRPGSISLVRLHSQVENKNATFTINREGNLDHVLTSVTLPNETRPPRAVSLTASFKESELLHDELEIVGHDYLFERTLQEIAQLLDNKQV